jgi:hypothetical protein
MVLNKIQSFALKHKKAWISRPFQSTVSRRLDFRVLLQHVPTVSVSEIFRPKFSANRQLDPPDKVKRL